jgi:peroxiredoxin
MGFQTKYNLEVGTKAPDFTLPSQSGEMVSLEDFIGNEPVGIGIPYSHKTPCEGEIHH